MPRVNGRRATLGRTRTTRNKERREQKSSLARTPVYLFRAIKRLAWRYPGHDTPLSSSPPRCKIHRNVAAIRLTSRVSLHEIRPSRKERITHYLRHTRVRFYAFRSRGSANSTAELCTAIFSTTLTNTLRDCTHSRTHIHARIVSCVYTRNTALHHAWK